MCVADLNPIYILWAHIPSMYHSCHYIWWVYVKHVVHLVLSLEITCTNRQYILWTHVPVVPKQTETCSAKRSNGGPVAWVIVAAQDNRPKLYQTQLNTFQCCEDFFSVVNSVLC